MSMKRTVLAAAMLLAAGAAAHSASSDRVGVEGGAVRLVMSSEPDAQGRLRGALEVDLEPGWKTYWLEPGGSGVPPSVEVSAGGQAVRTEIGFPAPQRHRDGGDVWAGYDRPVSFALTMEPPAGATVLDASVFLGVCEDICIPVKADFRIDTAAQASVADDEQVVDEAFADLPPAPREGFRVIDARANGQTLEVRAETPAGDAPVDLFLASSAGPVLGTPVGEAANGGTLFSVPLLAALDGEASQLRYTLVVGEDAVAGIIRIAP